MCVYVCVCLYLWVGKEGHTIVLPLALTHFGLACIFNPSNAKLSVVLFRGTLLKSVTVPLSLIETGQWGVMAAHVAC